MNCTHKQCDLCLRRECNLHERLKSFGAHLACDSCVRRAVNWAYKSAVTWGGEYLGSSEPCGKPNVPLGTKDARTEVCDEN